MHISNPADRDLSYATGAVQGHLTPSLCPRMHWRSVNPALPPPGTPTCRVGGPDCCVTSGVAGMRRAA
jgi:hypothetical protein